MNCMQFSETDQQIKLEFKNVSYFHEGGSGVTSWNDLTDKPFYKTTTVKEILPKTTVEHIYDEENTADVFVIPGEPGSIYIAVGAYCIVNYNGVEYKATAHDFDGLIGLVNDGGNLDTYEGVVFMITAITAEAVGEMPGSAVLIEAFDGSTPETLAIRGEVTEVKKISGKYVEGMGWSEKSVSGKVVVEETAYRVNNSAFGSLVNPEPLENGSYASMPTEFSFESGKTYRITVDGVPYIGTAEYRDGYGTLVEAMVCPW